MTDVVRVEMPPDPEAIRQQALWFLNTLRMAHAEENQDQVFALWERTYGMFDGSATMTFEDLGNLFLARTMAATWLVAKLVDLLVDNADLTRSSLFDDLQVIVGDWDFGSPRSGGDE